MSNQKDATKTGFPVALLDSFKGDFKEFKVWYDKKYKLKSAESVWKELETERARILARKKRK